MNRREIQKIVTRLRKAGWQADDDQDDKSAYALSPSELALSLEALVHEVTHNRMVSLKHMREPKTSPATHALLTDFYRQHRNRDGSWDEIRTTAVTIVACQKLGVEVQATALDSVQFNAAPDYHAVQAVAETLDLVKLRSTKRMAIEVVQYVRTL